MAVTYTRAQREIAKDRGLHLATIAVRGVEFQGPVTAEDAARLEEFLWDLFRRRGQAARPAAEAVTQ